MVPSKPVHLFSSQWERQTLPRVDGVLWKSGLLRQNEQLLSTNDSSQTNAPLHPHFSTKCTEKSTTTFLLLKRTTNDSITTHQPLPRNDGCHQGGCPYRAYSRTSHQSEHFD